MGRRLIAIVLFLSVGALEAQGRRASSRRPLELPPILTLLRGAPVQWSASARFPAVPPAMPLFTETSNTPPLELMARLLSGQNLQPFPSTSFARELGIKGPESLLAVTEEAHQRAWADRESGDGAIYPRLATLDALDEPPEQLRATAQTFFGELASGDDTAFAVDARPQVLMGVRATRASDGTWSQTSPQSYLAYFGAWRHIDRQWWVYGPGSRAIVAIGRGDKVAGFLRIWKKAKRSGTVVPQSSAEQVRSAIEAQLRPAARIGSVLVLSIELAYYDGNAAVLQPVYRFTARVRHRAYPDDVDEYVTGYVPYGTEQEPLPRLDVIAEEPKTDAGAGKQAPPGDPYVGSYVTRGDDPGWANDAAGFWRAVSAGATGPSFDRRESVAARPEMFVTAKQEHVNAMSLALVEAHGDWGDFWTKGCCEDVVHLASNGRPSGYGSATDGALGTLILHGCEIIPAPPDDPQWTLRWQSVFSGLRSIVGYRTPMVITDGAGAAYGASLSRGVPVVSSWIQDVASLDEYRRVRGISTHGHYHPLGRASVIVVCGHDDDPVFMRPLVAGPLCLKSWWMSD